MYRLEKWRLLLKLFSLMTLVTCLVLLSYRANLPSFMATKTPQTEPPTLSVESQAGSPLRISLQRYDLSNPQSPGLILNVVNVSDKAIRAYTISETTVRGVEKTRGATITDMSLTNSFPLQPGQLTTLGIISERSLGGQSNITVAVDFVDFTDGTSWGADVYGAGELLRGKRAGVHEATKHLIEILEAKGLQTVINVVNEGAIDLAPPGGRSPKWEEGFRNGLSFTSSQLKHVFKKDGLSRVELELRRLNERGERR